MQIFKTPNHLFSVTSVGCRFLDGVYGTLYLYPLLLITRYLSCWKIVPNKSMCSLSQLCKSL